MFLINNHTSSSDTSKRLHQPVRVMSDERMLTQSEILRVFYSMVFLLIPCVLSSTWLVNIFVISFLGIKFFSIIYQFIVSGWLLTVFAIVSITTFLVTVFPHFTHGSFVFILLLCATLKLLELKTLRDAFFILLVNCLLILGGVLFTRSFFWFVFLLVGFLYNFYVYLNVAYPNKSHSLFKSMNYRLLIKVILICLPFALLLFYFFPRMDPLWGVPSKRSKTGFSEQMTPNSLSRLVQDRGVAFRVKFDGYIPKEKDLYWRGPVLDSFDGRTWSRSQKKSQDNFFVDTSSSGLVSYRLYKNGGTGKWLTPLDIPTYMYEKHQQQFYLSENAEYYHPTDEVSGVYHFASDLDAKLFNLSDVTRRQNITYPRNKFLKAQSLAHQLSNQSDSKKEFVQKLLDYFSQSGFFYDLEPPIGNSDLDTFLFENKVGYCEHYASAFVFMLRSQGVPARVVTGYQGGSFNPISEELEVKQLHAHAWAEVYFSGEGWVRFDPTAAVAPNRVQSGSPIGVADNIEQIALTERFESQSKIYRTFAHWVRASSVFWQNWIVDFNKKKQASILNWGSKLDQYIMILIIVFLGLMGLALWFFVLTKQQKRNKDEVNRLVSQLVDFLNRNHVFIAKNQPFMSQLNQCKSQLSINDYNQLIKIADMYYTIRYRATGNKISVKLLEREVNYFIKNNAFKIQ